MVITLRDHHQLPETRKFGAAFVYSLIPFLVLEVKGRPDLLLLGSHLSHEHINLNHSDIFIDPKERTN